MPRYRKLVGDRCYLSPPLPEDAPLWAAWECDLDVAIPLGSEAYSVPSEERARQWIGEILHGDQHVYTIATVEGDVPIGRGMLFQISHVNRSAVLGIVIGDKTCWDRGYGTEAIQLLLDYGFNLLNLNSISLGSFAFNARALRCYEKVGFRAIGRKREARIICGRAYDVVQMDMLASEFVSPYVLRHLPGEASGARPA